MGCPRTPITEILWDAAASDSLMVAFAKEEIARLSAAAEAA
jgi:hypothetical protein